MFPKIDYQVMMNCIHPDCNESFGKTKDLINHFRAHHNTDLKCPHCGKEVKYGAGLIHHVRIHTGERPYFCPVSGCTFRSATKNNLKVHLSGKLHGWDVLMQFAHIFDRPKKKRHYSDLPDIIVKRQRVQMKGMQPMMGLGLPMMGMPMPFNGQVGFNQPNKIPPGIQMPRHMQPGANPMQNMQMPSMVPKQAAPTGIPKMPLKTVMPPNMNVGMNINAGMGIKIPQMNSILKDGSPIKNEPNDTVFIPEVKQEEKLAIVSHNDSAIIPKLENQAVV